MSAVWLKMVAVVWLFYAELTEAGVTWKKVGEFITIQCRADSKAEMLTLTRGLIVEEKIVHYSHSDPKQTLNEHMKERIQTNVVFPKVDILIKNLTVNDTGPYWCIYSTIDKYSQLTKSPGSLLLVVTENQPAASTEVVVCESSDLNLLILSAVAFAVTMLFIMLFLIIWLKCKKRNSSSRSVKTSRPTNNNDVYEDMRGTIRR